MAGAKKQHSVGGLAGCVQRRRCRATGTLIAIFDSEAQGLDPSDPWTVSCEDHGEILQTASLAQAKLHAAYPEWCSCCSAILYGDDD